MKLAHLIVLADVAVVAFVEKTLMTPEVVHGHVTRTAPKELIITGLLFALPALLILLAAWLRGRAAAKPAPAASRPSFTGYSVNGRR